MSVFQMVVMVVAIVFFAGIIKEYLKFKTKSSEKLSGLEDRIDQIENLEKRVRVLESIVTDKQYDLKKEIGGL